MHFINLVFILTVALGQEQFNYDYTSTGLVVANIKRRDTIPLQAGSKRFISNRLNYRRTKDIRQELADRRFEISEAQLREAQREAQLRNAHINEMREEEMKSRIRDDLIRNEMQARGNEMQARENEMQARESEMQARGNEMRNPEMTQNQIEDSVRNDYNQINPNYADKDINKLQREMRWLTIDTDDVPEI